MNSIERDILIRCLDLIYGQLLTGSSENGLQSIEELISLIRYIGREAAPQSTLGEEARVVQAVFQLYQTAETPPFQVSFSQMDPHTPLRRSAVVYEVCQHGMELMHNGCLLKSVCFFSAGGHISYALTDSLDAVYRGMIYESERQPG